MFSAALFAAVVLSAPGCVHARWPAKTLADGVPVSTTTMSATVPQLRALTRPPGVGIFVNARLPQERQVYRLRVVLLRFSLADDGDVHLAIADPRDRASTMIAEIPDPARMNSAPVRYRDEVARTRRNFIAAFGAPVFNVWRPSGREVKITGPIFFDLPFGQIGGQAGGAPNGIEIHPVLRIEMLNGEQTRRHSSGKSAVPRL